MQREIIISEVSQKEKDKYWYLCYVSDSTYMQSVIHDRNEAVYKTLGNSLFFLFGIKLFLLIGLKSIQEMKPMELSILENIKY